MTLRQSPVIPNNKPVLTVFFNHEGAVHCEIFLPSQTINKYYYIKILCQMRNTCARFYGKTLHLSGVAAPNNADFTPCDFWLSPDLKSLLEGTKFQAMDYIENTMRQVMAIPKAVFANCFKKRRDSRMCVRSKENCFEVN